MNAHTPAPWKVNKDNHPACTMRVYSSRGSMIANVDCAMPKEENQANARLIAAAPELLAALKAVTLALEVGYTNSKPMRIIVAEANAAIAKAQG